MIREGRGGRHRKFTFRLLHPDRAAKALSEKGGRLSLTAKAECPPASSTCTRPNSQAAMSDPIFTRYEAHSFTVLYSHNKVGGSSTPTSSSISIARMTASMDCNPYFENGASGYAVLHPKRCRNTLNQPLLHLIQIFGLRHNLIPRSRCSAPTLKAAPQLLPRAAALTENIRLSR